MKMSVEHRWNDTDRVNRKYWQMKLSMHHFVHHKTHVDWPGIEPGLPL
jgi:hypothetical protein